MGALYSIVNSVLTLAIYAFLLRVLLQFARVDFRNPLAQAILALTNWLVLPLRRVLPPMGRLDTASIFALLAVHFTATWILASLQPTSAVSVVPLVLASLSLLAKMTIWFYIVVIILYALLSFIAPNAYSPVVGLVSSLCRPLLVPISRILPTVGGIDFSPLVVIILLRAALYLFP